MNSIKIIIPALFVMLTACETVNRPQPVEAKSALSSSIADTESNDTPLPPPPAVMPDSVQNELAASRRGGAFSAAPRSARRFDVSANAIDAKVFFASLVKGTGISVAVQDDVQGKISLSLKGVTLNEVLQVVENMYGFEVVRAGKVLQIFPAGLRTETIALNYLDMERHGLSLTSVNSGRISDSNSNSGSNSSNSSSNSSSSNSNSSSNGGAANSNESSDQTNGTFIRSATKSNFWGELQQTLVSIIGETGQGRQVVISPQAGLVTVRAFPDEIRQVKQFLSTAERHLQRQVILEAKIIEVTLSDGYQQGINWDSVLGHVGNTDIEFGTSAGSVVDSITSVIGGASTINISGADFTTVISLLDTQGDVDVLSSPRVTAMNNQKAVIKVGTDEYFVTNISSTTVASTTPVTSPEVELTPFFSGIALDVTPQIDSEGSVLLHIHPSVIDIKEQTKVIQISADSSLELPLAQSDIRESDTVIRAKSGDVVVIGGLMKSSNTELASKVPLLGDIPFLGEAFTNRSKALVKTELVILLKPVVVGKGTWKNELKRSQRLLDRWYPEEQ